MSNDFTLTARNTIAEAAELRGPRGMNGVTQRIEQVDEEVV
jgi:hypothetical protein